MTAVPKTKPVQDQDWLDYLKTQPCIVTGFHATEWEGVDPAHIGTYARGLKTDDEALPLIHSLHHKTHNAGLKGGEMTIWRKMVPNDVLRAALRALAREMYREWKRDTDT